MSKQIAKTRKKKPAMTPIHEFDSDCECRRCIAQWDRNPDDFDNEALDAVEPHTETYWRLAQSGKPHKKADDPLPDPGDLDRHDGFYGYRWTVDDGHIRMASYQLATLLFGPDNGSINRDDIECQMQKVIKMSFDYWSSADER